MSEEQVNNIAAAFAATQANANSQEQIASAAQLQITELTSQLQAAQALATAAEGKAAEAATALTNATEQVTNLTTERDALQAKVTELSGKPSGTGSTTVTGAAPESVSTATTGKPSWYVPDGSEAKLERANAGLGALAE